VRIFILDLNLTYFLKDRWNLNTVSSAYIYGYEHSNTIIKSSFVTKSQKFTSYSYAVV